MAQLPSCSDDKEDLQRKILLQLISMADEPPSSLSPSCSDSSIDLYKKILLTLPFI